MDFAIRRLAVAFCGSGHRATGRLWTDLKKYIAERGLTGELQSQLQAVARSFAARHAAAHYATVISQTGEATQIFRMYYRDDRIEVEAVTIDDLRLEAERVRAGHAAMQTIGRKLDDDDPTVLAALNQIPKYMLIGRLS